MEQMIVLQSTPNKIYDVQLGVWLVIFMYKSIVAVRTKSTLDTGLESSMAIAPN
jgi:hypothetical protein